MLNRKVWPGTLNANPHGLYGLDARSRAGTPAEKIAIVEIKRSLHMGPICMHTYPIAYLQWRSIVIWPDAER